MPTINVRWSDNTADLTKHLKEGLNQIEATKASVTKLVESLRGDKLVQSAHKWTAAIAEMGGVAKISSEAQTRAFSTITKAIETLDRQGRPVPETMRAIARELEATQKKSDGLTTRMVALGSAIGTFLGHVAYDGVKRLAGGIVDIASNGIKLAPTVDAFQRLSAAAGQSGDEMLRITKTATKGLIADLDIMQAANKGLLLGLPITAEEMGVLGKTAVVLGKAMGQGAAKSMDDLITALGRSSPMILDNLGLSVKVGEANEAYARALGKSADALTDNEKKLAFYNAAMTAAKAKVEDLGGVQLTLADRVLQVRNAMTNFTDSLGVAIATSPVVNAALGAIADAVGSAFGDNQTVLVQKLIGYVNQFAIGLVEAAQIGVTTAGVFQRAWSGLQLIFAATASIVSAIGLAFANLVAGAASVATKIPGLGAAFDGVARSARDMATFMGGVQQSFHDQAAEALEGVKGNSEFQRTLDRVSGTLTTMRGKMVEAAKAGVDSAVIADQLAKAHDNVSGAAAKTVAELKKEAAELERVKQKIRELEAALPSAEVSLGGLVDKATIDRLKTFTEQWGKANQKIAEVSRVGLPDFLDGIEKVGRSDGEVERLTVAIKQTEKALDDAAKAGGAFSRFIDGIPSLITSAFTGGGGLTGAIKGLSSQVGAALFGPTGLLGFGAGGALNGAANKLTKVFGDTIGFALPGIGAAIGSLVGPLVGSIGKLFGKLFNDPEKQVNPIREAFVQAAGGLEELNVRAHNAGLTLDRLLDARNPEQYKKAIEDLNAAFQFQDAAMQTLDETVKKYGFSLEELGPQLRAQELGKQAQEIFQDFSVLTAGGIEAGAVIRRMTEKTNEYVHAALTMGAEVPEAMRPMLARMADMGLLTDENGNVITDLKDSGIVFAETMTQGFDRVVKAVNQLVDAITRGLNPAVASVPPVYVPVIYDDPGFQPSVQTANFNPYAARGGIVTPSGVQYFARGGNVLPFMPRGADTVPAMLTPGEWVINESQQRHLASLIFSGARGRAAGGGSSRPLDVNVVLQMDRDVMAKKTIRITREALADGQIAVPARAVVSRPR